MELVITKNKTKFTVTKDNKPIAKVTSFKEALAECNKVLGMGLIVTSRRDSWIVTKQ